jgi:uncharacterized protein
MPLYQNALVTGASSGLGSEFATQLAPHTTHLLLVARRMDRLEALKSTLQARYPQCRVTLLPCDLSNAAELETLIRSIPDQNIDLLINNAGLGDLGLLETAPPNKLNLMMQVNMVALTLLTRAALPDMVKRGRGSVLQVSSSAGYLPLPTFTVYAATKTYVNHFTDALRAELRGTGVHVTALCPGPVETEFGQVANRPDGKRTFAAPSLAYVSAQAVVSQALQGLARNQARVAPGWAISFFVFSADFVPSWLWRFLQRFGEYRK